MEKVSIIVPVYNKAWCLDRCMDTVLAQTCQDFKLILIDDGSKDDSLAICQAYAARDPRICVISQPNGGVSSARNTGIEAAAGEYIVFLDPDDWWEPDFLACMLACADACGKDCLPICGMYHNGQAQRQVLFASEPETQLGIDGIYTLYQKHFLNMIWNKLFSGDMIRKHNIRFPVGIHWGEDKLFVLAYLQHVSGYRIINRPLYHYAISDTGLDRCLKKDELQLNQMLHQALFSFTANLPGEHREKERMLCAEYMRVQIEGALRQIKQGRTMRYAAYLRKDALLRQCMQTLKAEKRCSGLLCLCQRYSALALILCYTVMKKPRRSPDNKGM